jgi:adenylate kinase
MRLAFFGPPGAGKGTQSEYVSRKFDLRTISTGELIRTAIAEKSETGRQAEVYVHSGRLVPGELVRELANQAIADLGFDNFILDGYPRTIEQANWLSAFLKAYKSPFQAVISLEVPDELIILRLSRRRINSATGETYHLDFRPPSESVDPSLIIRRTDDEPESIQRRLDSYRQDTFPLKEYYRGRNLLIEIDGSGDIHSIRKKILEYLSGLTPLVFA